jgi:ribosomal-protein-alanine N-acetyltransferase
VRQPVIATERLVLRPFELGDAPAVQRLAGDPAVAATTANIPHPYPDGAAEAFIQRTRADAERGLGYTFAVVGRDGGTLLACVGLRLDPPHRRAELGYWVGRPYWGRGIATEAAAAVLRFGFREVGLNRIFATALVRNPASARVMQKVGMRLEGTLRQHVVKDGVPEDLVLYGLTQGEYGGAGGT